MASICNISFDNVSWAQATLPIKKGGIGLRLPEDVCLPAYISSLSSCRALVQDVLIHFPELPLDSPYDRGGQPMAHAPYVAQWLLKSGALRLFDDKSLLLTNFLFIFIFYLTSTDIFRWKTEHQRA